MSRSGYSDDCDAIAAEVRFWAYYEFLYGGVYESLIARRYGYASAAEMRRAKFAEWVAGRPKAEAEVQELEAELAVVKGQRQTRRNNE